MKAQITVTLKKGVLDPQGEAIGQSLKNQGFTSLETIRQGRFFEVELSESDKAQAQKTVDAMCQKMLANQIIETYRYEIS